MKEKKQTAWQMIADFMAKLPKGSKLDITASKTAMVIQLRNKKNAQSK